MVEVAADRALVAIGSRAREAERAALLGELCVGLEGGSIWAVFRDGDGEVCATPVHGEGVFAAAAG